MSNLYINVIPTNNNMVHTITTIVIIILLHYKFSTILLLIVQILYWSKEKHSDKIRQIKI